MIKQIAEYKILLIIILLTMISCNSSDKYHKRGMTKFSQKEYSSAIEYFNKAIALKPDNLKVYYDMGVTKLFKGDVKGAKSDFNKIIEFLPNPNNVEEYLLRAKAKGELEDNKGALEDINKALELDPKNRVAYFDRAFVRQYLRDFDGALDDFDEIIKINPQDSASSDAYMIKAGLECNLGRRKKALEDFIMAEKLGHKGLKENIESIRVNKNMCTNMRYLD